MNIGNFKANVLRQSQDSSDLAIHVTYLVEEGLAYDWGGVRWSGNHAESAADLETLVGMKPGERANGKKIDAGLEAVQEAYGRKGYLEMRLMPQITYDEATHRVEYDVAVTEGSQYKMGEISFTGLPAAVSLKSKWRLQPGDVYDASYLKEFMKTQLSSALSSSGGWPPRIQTSIKPDRVAHTVDVSIQVQ